MDKTTFCLYFNCGTLDRNNKKHIIFRLVHDVQFYQDKPRGKYIITLE